MPKFNHRPQIFSSMTIVEFDVISSPKSLVGVLLDHVVDVAAPSLQSRRRKIVDDVISAKRTRAECERDVLGRLGGAPGHVLIEDDTLIVALGKVRSAASAADARIIKVDAQRATLQEERDGYLPEARRLAAVFECSQIMCHVNSMYAPSLALFFEQIRGEF